MGRLHATGDENAATREFVFAQLNKLFVVLAMVAVILGGIIAAAQ